MSISQPCPADCPLLATETGPPGSSGPIPPEHFGCAWRAFERHVRASVVKALLRLPLGRLCLRLTASHVNIRRSPALVRIDLAESAEVDDLVQEVACAMASAVKRGKLVAARPAIYRWIEQTVYWLVPERSRQTVIAALTGAPLALAPANDNAGEPSEVERIVFASGETPEDTYARREDARERMGRLTRGQRDVFERAAEGMDHAEIAIDLGISQGAVRLRLMQARRRLRRNG